MGQSQSSSSRATASNRRADAARTTPSARDDFLSAASLPPPASSSTASEGPTTSSALLLPSDPASSVPRASSARSLSQRIPKLSLRSRRRSVGVSNLAQDAEDHGAPESKRRWLRSLHGRPSNAVLTGTSSHSAGTGEASTSTPGDRKLIATPDSGVGPVAVAGPSTVVANAVEAVPPPAALTPASTQGTESMPAPPRDRESPVRAIPRVEPAAQAATNPDTAAHPPTLHQPTRNGQPSSSLIIVQGIVHTQDNPLSPNPTSTPTSTPSSSGMPSLNPSGFLRRRRSGRSSSRHSLAQLAAPVTSPSGPGTPNEEPAAAAPPAAASADDAATQLSQSSIEVLGTLLSFATAATAASLVTGSIDPLFHSGLHQSPDASPTEPSQGAQGADRASRLRSALGGMRDLFRANRRRAADDPHSPDALLGELARAINAGLAAGRTHLPADAPAGTASVDPAPAALPSQIPVSLQAGSDAVDPANLPLPPSPSTAEYPESVARSAARAASAPTTATPSPLPPPNGRPNQDNSFERFLHNLQTDLRTALTEDYARPTHRAESPSSESSTPSSPTSDSSSSSAATDASGIPVVLVQRPSEPDIGSSSSSAPQRPSTDAPSTSSSYEGARPSQPANGAQGENNGINWWRLYRFPPTRMPAGAAMAGAAPAPPTPAAPASASSNQEPATDAPTPQPASSSRYPETSSADATANTGAPAALPSAGTQQPLVVPVIVVGLQSVSAADAADILPPEARQEAENAAASAAAPSVAPPGGSQRRAPSLMRAARALNRLSSMPWRSDAAASTPSLASTPTPGPAASGSAAAGPPPTRTSTGRTYLIYVIGGYYPLDHSIVTGDLNSFEALWQLADLLGQVKPPVATRDEIEKSGLHVFKAKALSQYEEEGKVAENTIERCLVCLDDYEDEDDLRLLSCRHVFHKSCVDKWLEEGKNNCPACRAKGVATRSDADEATAAVTPAPIPEPTV